MDVIFVIVATLTILLLAPRLSAALLRLNGGFGKAALIAFPLLGCIQLIAFVSPHLGALGGLVGFLLSIAAWFHLIRIVYGTDTSSTIVFMFWHIFFVILLASLFSLFVGQSVWLYTLPFFK
jgi:hypothetical protein